MADVRSLRDLVEQRRAELGRPGRPLSYQALADRAQKAGGKASRALLWQIGSGTHSGNLKDEEARGVALAIDVPASRVFRLRGGPAPGRPFADELPDGVDRLTRRQRQAVLSVVRAMLDPGAEEAGADVTQLTPRPVPGPQKRVARGRTPRPPEEHAE